MKNIIVLLFVLISITVFAQYNNPSAVHARQMQQNAFMNAGMNMKHSLKYEQKTSKKALEKNERKLAEVENEIEKLQSTDSPEDAKKIERLEKRRADLNFQVAGFKTIIAQRGEEIKRDSIRKHNIKNSRKK